MVICHSFKKFQVWFLAGEGVSVVTESLQGWSMVALKSIWLQMFGKLLEDYIAMIVTSGVEVSARSVLQQLLLQCLLEVCCHLLHD